LFRRCNFFPRQFRGQESSPDGPAAIVARNKKKTSINWRRS
jgi:hypothetical protein